MDDCKSSASIALYEAFKSGSDDFRLSRLKILPLIVDGNPILKRLVGNRPSVIGSKLKCTYYPGPDFLEVVVDISSCKFARSAASLALRLSESLVVDLAFVIEAQELHELPERVLSAIRLIHVGRHDGVPWSSLEHRNLDRSCSRTSCPNSEKNTLYIEDLRDGLQSSSGSTRSPHRTASTDEISIIFQKLRRAFSVLRDVRNLLSD